MDRRYLRELHRYHIPPIIFIGSEKPYTFIQIGGEQPLVLLSYYVQKEYENM